MNVIHRSSIIPTNEDRYVVTIGVEWRSEVRTNNLRILSDAFKRSRHVMNVWECTDGASRLILQV